MNTLDRYLADSKKYIFAVRNRCIFRVPSRFKNNQLHNASKISYEKHPQHTSQSQQAHSNSTVNTTKASLWSPHSEKPEPAPELRQSTPPSTLNSAQFASSSKPYAIDTARTRTPPSIRFQDLNVSRLGEVVSGMVIIIVVGHVAKSAM